MAWDACNKLDMVWRSDLDIILKVRLFKACVESILLYGSETWTFTSKMKFRIDGCYTRLLSVGEPIWHMINNELYGNIPLLSPTIKQRRLRFAGHCYRAVDHPAENLFSGFPSDLPSDLPFCKLSWMVFHALSKYGQKSISFTVVFLFTNKTRFTWCIYYELSLNG